jgi:hypothetical protein
VLDWEDGDFAVVEGHWTESEVFPDQTVLWSNLVPSWVAPLEVCMGIAMVTGYDCVLQGLAVCRVVVKVPLTLGRCLLQRGEHWLH